MPAGSPPCRECGAPSHYRNRQPLCQACNKGYCCGCGAKKPPGRRSRYCLDCTRQQWQERLQKQQVCSSCGERPPTPRSARCSDCLREEYLLQRKALLHRPPGDCQECGKPLPQGRRLHRCSTCETRRRKEINRYRPCACCQVRPRYGANPHCQPCHRMQQNWHRAYHRGDPAARMVRPIGKRQRWQKEESSQRGE